MLCDNFFRRSRIYSISALECQLFLIAKEMRSTRAHGSPEIGFKARLCLGPAKVQRSHILREGDLQLALQSQLRAVFRNRRQALACAQAEHRDYRQKPWTVPISAGNSGGAVHRGQLQDICVAENRWYYAAIELIFAMTVLAYGINHRSAPITLRERLAFPDHALPAALHSLRGSLEQITETAILSTCNRAEFYVALGEGQLPDVVRALRQWLQVYRNTTLPEGVDYTLLDEDAVMHLVRVASGIDSQVLGETQIMGQVKTAWANAREAGCLGPKLELMCEVALNSAKRIRSETRIGESRVSYASVCMDLASRLFASLAKTRVLLIGAGPMIELFVNAVRARGVATLAIANRTLATAESLLQGENEEAIPLEALDTRLHEFDLVISSTGSRLPIVSRTMLESAIRARRRRPMLVVDMAVPRDVEAEVGELSDVFLYAIDDLTNIIEEGVSNRREAAAEAESLLREGAHQFRSKLAAQERGDLVRNYRESMESIRESELTSALADLDRGADPQEVLRRLSTRLSAQLMHLPTETLRTGNLSVLEKSHREKEN